MHRSTAVFGFFSLLLTLLLLLWRPAKYSYRTVYEVYHHHIHCRYMVYIIVAPPVSCCLFFFPLLLRSICSSALSADSKKALSAACSFSPAALLLCYVYSRVLCSADMECLLYGIHQKSGNRYGRTYRTVP